MLNLALIKFPPNSSGYKMRYCDTTVSLYKTLLPKVSVHYYL